MFQTKATSLVATPPAVQATSVPTESLIAQEDTFEGQLTTTRVRVQGTLRGTIIAHRTVRIDPGAEVEAEIQAAEVVIAGTYRGTVTCRERAEITATGQVDGQVATPRLLLQEGGYVAGTLHMDEPTAEEARPVSATEVARLRWFHATAQGHATARPSGDGAPDEGSTDGAAPSWRA